MKRLTVLLLTLLILLPLEAGYSPSFTVSGGMESLDFRYHAVRTRADISLLSLKIDYVTVSLPLSISYVTKSRVEKGLLSPEHYKNGVGLEVFVSNDRIGTGAAVFYGYEDFTEENAMMRYLEFILSPSLILDKYIAISLPFSYTYTPEGKEYSISLAVRMGGEI